MKKNPIVLALLLLSNTAFAASTPNLSNLSQAESDSIMKNFGNAIAFRSLEPPSSNGAIWGFGIGILGEVTGAGDLNSALVAHGAQEISAIPAGDIVLTLQGPLGISGELGFLPRMTIGGFKFKRTAFNAKWTFTDVLLRGETPFDAALRIGFGDNEFSYSQVVSGINDTVSFSSKATRFELAMSRKFLVLEPYIGLGLLSTSSKLSNTAAVTLYNFTSADSFEYSKSSFFFNLGAEVRLVFLTVGAQVEWAFGETTGAAKLGLKF
jgi:hypothetical protein